MRSGAVASRQEQEAGFMRKEQPDAGEPLARQTLKRGTRAIDRQLAEGWIAVRSAP
jgi:hypothetical protein